MKKEFIPYAEALTLKELGFDEFCMFYYTEDKKLNHHMLQNVIVTSNFNNFNKLSAPLYQQVWRWFREKYNFNSFIVDSKSYDWYFNINNMITDDVVSEVLDFKTYEEAELECLKKLIKIVKNGTN